LPVPPKGPPPNHLMEKYMEKEQKTDQSSSSTVSPSKPLQKKRRLFHEVSFDFN
jgi:hypothetical protein